MAANTKFFTRMMQGSIPLWGIVGLIGIYSMLELYSASSQLVIEKPDVNGEILHHFCTLVTGFVGAVVLSHLANSGKRIRGITGFIGGLGVLCLLILLLPASLAPHLRVMGLSLIDVGTENGASRWIVLMGVQFQPSELLKVGLVSAVAFVLTAPASNIPLMRTICRMTRHEVDDEPWVDKLRFIYGSALSGFAFLIVFSDNLSTALLIAATGLLLTWLSGTWKKAAVISFFALFLIAVIAFVSLHSISHEGIRNVGLPERAHTWKNRIDQKLSQETTKFEYNDVTRQTVHSQIAIARGGYVGRMPGNSIERDFLPQIYADFVFAIIVEELGFIFGACALMLLYIALFWRCCKTAFEAKDNYLALLVFGFGVLIIIQALMSMGVAANIGPVTGQPLPLISRGKTSIIVTFVFIGLIQGVAAMAQRKAFAQTTTFAPTDEEQGEVSEQEVEQEETIKPSEE